MNRIRGGVKPQKSDARPSYGTRMTRNEEPTNTQGVPDDDEEADTASGGAPEEPDTSQGQDGR